MNPLVIKFGGYQKPASINNAAARRFVKSSRRASATVSFQLIGNVLDLGRRLAICQ